MTGTDSKCMAQMAFLPVRGAGTPENRLFDAYTRADPHITSSDAHTAEPGPGDGQPKPVQSVRTPDPVPDWGGGSLRLS
jgi:hypothetical protein